MNGKTKIWLVAPTIVFGLAFFSGASAWCQNEARSEARIDAPTPNVAEPAAAETGPSDPVVLSSKPANEVPAESQWQSRNWHMQSTIVGQGYPSFSAKYTGANSLPTADQARETVSLDFYAGYRLWRGAEFHTDLLTWQGFGLDGTLGIEDFTNGEAYKIGTRYPHTILGRFFIRQTIGLGGEKEAVPSDQLTLAGDLQPARLTFTVGRYSSIRASTI
jgi:high affinity Mn2+ porin